MPKQDGNTKLSCCDRIDCKVNWEDYSRYRMKRNTYLLLLKIQDEWDTSCTVPVSQHSVMRQKYY